ncbi:MAG: FtsX-like permease family protein [Pirellulaceae bacterium]|nr:FtsX-like permease family protein [Pirellulaceae bacterium]
MTNWRLILASLRFHWRMHGAVALGVAAATAVLTGALFVGDSVRGTLRGLVLDRLGKIDELLIVDRFFRAELAAELAADPKFPREYAAAIPAILIPSAAIERPADDGRRRAGGVSIIAAADDFWRQGDAKFEPPSPPGAGQIVLNVPLAEELGAKIGDPITLHLGKLAQLPADSPLGRKDDLVASVAELKVSAIIPAASLGRFSLLPTQTTPRNAFVSLATLQEGLDQPGRANAIFVAGRQAFPPPSESASRELAAALRPQLADEGLTLKQVRQIFGTGSEAQPVFDYWSLTSERMLLDETVEREALAAFAEFRPQPVLTYLANLIEKVSAAGDQESQAKRKGIPYSTIAALDPAPAFPLLDSTGQPLPKLGDDEIALASWAADDQQAKIGDRIRVTYFEPETIHGDEVERTVEFRVAAIIPLTEPDMPFSRRKGAEYTSHRPTTANDPDLTPEVKGITDQATIADWDAPFPFDHSLLRGQDDRYWDNHRTTPKAYVSLAAGRRLWGSRFGRTTSIRIPAAAGSAAALEEKLLAQLKTDDEPLGLEFRPLKRQGLQAAAGTTPFDVLFLSLSMFIIAAALMLVWLLFRLGIEQRASEIGALVALGWTRRRTSLALLAEGSLVAMFGAAFGAFAGIAYAWLMIVGLRTWWSGAIAAPTLVPHPTLQSFLVGWGAGIGVAAVTIWFSLRGLLKLPPRRLMAGATAPAADWSRAAGQPAIGTARKVIYATLFVLALGLAFLASLLGGEAQAGAFLGAGALTLVFLVLAIGDWLQLAGRRASGTFTRAPLPTLATRGAARNPGRSVTTIALMASAAFLIVAVSSFRLRPSAEGIGGFNLLAESAGPVIDDLASPAVRKEMFAAKAAELAETTILPLRLRSGDDASCRNLYQPSQPRIMGITPALVRHFDDPAATHFRFAASAAKTTAERANPWQLLAIGTAPNEPVPVVIDKNTAMYSLRLYRGVGEEFTVTYDDAPPIRFRVAGLLENSVLQGSLLVSEVNFTRLFPRVSGYRFFLIETPPATASQIATLLEDRLGDEGFDTTDAHQRLSELLAVQNTYISTFQALGALGLVLGTLGLAAVQLRNVFERRKELALLRATGFRGQRLGMMVLLENLLLLLAGLLSGALAALVTVLPHMFFGGARVPLGELSLTLLAVVAIGLVTGLLAVRATLRAPLVAALRGE